MLFEHTIMLEKMVTEQQIRSKKTEGTCTLIEPVHSIPNIEEDVRTGLLSHPQSLPPKYFYDEHGSLLFEKICNTPEYYLTRTEEKLLSSHSKEIISKVKPAEIIELGSGSAKKTRHLFDACIQNNHTCAYSPFDVCEPILENITEQLQSDYDWLKVTPLLGDYHAGLKYLPKNNGTRLYVFLGGTVGNFYPKQAENFIHEIKTNMQLGDYLLLGADRVKDNKTLNMAYNDAQGVTAKFNLNILNVINRELKADFNPENFQHKAEFNQEKKRMEMYILCNHDHVVCLQALDEKITFLQGSKILTEVSYKFTDDEIENLLVVGGLNISEHYEPNNKFFSLLLAHRGK
ncbi:hypothetical protein SPBRAN_222 [uncultured Candidatus Thioglobus sp.]|nr:hypothetical protein SPBRAN_222 [uncultured Candidatus Thioglobus sp.]